MKKQELIKRIEVLPYTEGPIADTITINRNWILESIEQLAESEIGHADEAPRYVKNILARLRELPLHDREVWLKAIMSEFEQDFSHAKWREGYEQGKIEGEWVGQQLKDADKVRKELNKPVILQFVADWYEENKDGFEGNLYRFVYNLTSIFDGAKLNEFERWFLTAGTKPFQTLINMHQFGYEIEKEPKYTVRVKGINGYGRYLNKALLSKEYFFASENEVSGYRTKHTRKELEADGFGWVFSCEGIEVEEVE